MKLAHHVTLELFVRQGETEAAIDALVPVPLSEIRAVQWRWHPTRERTRVYDTTKRKVLLVESVSEGEEGDIVVLQYRFSRQAETDAFLERLRELPEEELEELRADIDDHLDADGDLLLRLSRKAAELGMLKLGKGLLVRINLAAFPKNARTCTAAARRALGSG